MKEENTIKASFRNKIVIYSLIPVMTILLIISIVFSAFRWNQYYGKLDTDSVNNAQYINMQFNYLEHTLNNIASDGIVEEVMSIDEKTDFSKKILLLDELKKYCNRFYNSYNAERIDIKLYHNNKNIYRGDYIGYTQELNENILQEVLKNENYVGRWIADDNKITLYCNMSNEKYDIILSCSINNISLNGFMDTNIYYSNMGLSSQNISIQNSEPAEKSIFNIIQPLQSGQYLVINIPPSKIPELFLPVIGICLAIALFVFVISYILSNNTSAKLTEKIYNFFDFIKSNKLYENMDMINIDKDNELYGMFEKVKQLMNDIENANREKNKLLEENTNLQLEYAQSQINPHLLYNSLSIIRWDCMESNPELVDKIDAMVDYYRLSINNFNENYTVNDEIELIKKYLRLISYLHEVDYKYTVSIDERLMKMPALQHIFQPFIENAILHGINGNPDGRIKITGTIDSNNVVFRISDNGTGFDKNAMKARVSEGFGKHIGIQNTIYRIKLHYGSESMVDIISSIGKGTEVIINIPADDTIIFK